MCCDVIFRSSVSNKNDLLECEQSVLVGVFVFDHYAANTTLCALVVDGEGHSNVSFTREGIPY